LAKAEPSRHGAASSSSSSNDSASSNSSSSETEGSPAAAAAAADVPQSVLKQRPYFVNVAAAHVAGLLAAFAANSITHLGQPALLYIVPATLLTVLGTAAAKGDLARVWQFTDVPSFGVAALIVEPKKEG
jgi:minor histocompatibility antigen H13